MRSGSLLLRSLAFGEWGDESAQFRRPRKDAIARALLDQWISDELGTG